MIDVIKNECKININNPISYLDSSSLFKEPSHLGKKSGARRMSSQFPWTDVVAIVIAFFALLLSIYTLYVTKIHRFKGYVVQAPKMSLTWTSVEDQSIPCLYIECQFVNQGAKPGRIIDVIVELFNTESGDRQPLIAFLVKYDAIDIFVESSEQEQSLEDFSSIWLKPDESKNVPIFFKSTGSGIPLNEASTYLATLLYSGDNIKRRVKRKTVKWVRSQVSYSYRITENVLAEWNDQKTLRLEAVELVENRHEAYKYIQL